MVEFPPGELQTAAVVAVGSKDLLSQVIRFPEGCWLSLRRAVSRQLNESTSGEAAKQRADFRFRLVPLQERVPLNNQQRQRLKRNVSRNSFWLHWIFSNHDPVKGETVFVNVCRYWNLTWLTLLRKKLNLRYAVFIWLTGNRVTEIFMHYNYATNCKTIIWSARLIRGLPKFSSKNSFSFFLTFAVRPLHQLPT